METIMVTASRRHQVRGTRVDEGSPFAPPARVPGDLAMLALNDGGVIVNCSQACEQLFGYRQDELGGHHVSTLLPHLENTELVLEDRINARLAFLCRCATFQARRRDGEFFTSELFINRLGNQNVVVLVRSLES
jgi:PAS domain S-box-containing protein